MRGGGSAAREYGERMGRSCFLFSPGKERFYFPPELLYPESASQDGRDDHLDKIASAPGVNIKEKSGHQRYWRFVRGVRTCSVSYMSRTVCWISFRWSISTVVCI